MGVREYFLHDIATLEQQLLLISQPESFLKVVQCVIAHSLGALWACWICKEFLKNIFLLIFVRSQLCDIQDQKGKKLYLSAEQRNFIGCTSKQLRKK